MECTNSLMTVYPRQGVSIWLQNGRIYILLLYLPLLYCSWKNSQRATSPSLRFKLVHTLNSCWKDHEGDWHSNPFFRSPRPPTVQKCHCVCCRGKEVVNKKVQYTQEQARLKREQMAAAAEARMAALRLASQQQTLWSDSCP